MILNDNIIAINGPKDKIILISDGTCVDELYLPDLTEKDTQVFVDRWAGEFGSNTLRTWISEGRDIFKESLSKQSK